MQQQLQQDSSFRNVGALLDVGGRRDGVLELERRREAGRHNGHSAAESSNGAEANKESAELKTQHGSQHISQHSSRTEQIFDLKTRTEKIFVHFPLERSNTLDEEAPG